MPAFHGVLNAPDHRRASRFDLTEDEAELRARSYALIHTNEDESWGQAYRTRLASLGLAPSKRERRRRVAHSAGTAFDQTGVQPSRAAVLRARILTDLALAGEFAAVALRIYRADLVRRRALRRDYDISADDFGNATARIAENRRVVANTILALENRIDDYALESRRGILADPQFDEATVARATRRLERTVRDLRRELRELTGPRAWRNSSLPGRIRTPVSGSLS